MKKCFAFFAIGIATCFAFSCNKMEEKTTADNSQKTEASIVTRAFGDKNLLTAVYVETNDVNPLNAKDYYVEYNLENIPFFDILELFASNIHKEPYSSPVRPCLYLNDKLTNVLENGGATTYVRPLKNAGIKVLLTVLGDWQHIGVANMDDTQQHQFANILAWAVEKYGLDGIGFDDEYADYPYGSLVSGSFGNIITLLRGLIGTDKIITVFDWGNTHQISAADAANVNYVYHGSFGQYYGLSNCNVAGTTAAKWFPYSLNLGQTYNSVTVQSNTARVLNDGYAGVMMFNLRKRNDVDPLPVLQAIANGAGWGTVSCSNGNRDRDAVIDPDGFNLTNAAAKAGLSAAGKLYYNY